MNIDLITKLAKLANNNPNENEANLAARKVCKLLAEGEFKFGMRSAVDDAKVRSASNPSGPGFDFSGFYKDKWRNRTQEEKKWSWQPTKEQEDFFRSYMDDILYGVPFGGKKTNPYNREWEKSGDSPFDKARSYAETKEEYKARTKPPFDNSTRTYTDPLTGKRTKMVEERLLKCKTCGHVKLSKFVGLAELYECNTCQWTAFERDKK